MKTILFVNFNPRISKHLHIGFREVGVKVAHYVNEFENMAYSLLENKLTSLIKSTGPDAVISYGWWETPELAESYCSAIKRWDIPHIYWATDDPPLFESMSLPIGTYSDVVFTTAAECIKAYNSNGVKAALLPFACCPRQHKRVVPSPRLRHDIILVANNYNIFDDPGYFKYRLSGLENMVKPVAAGTYDFKAWGYWWRSPERIYNLPERYYGLHLPYRHTVRAYSSCKIALGLQSVGTSRTMLSSRTFETLGCGAFHLTQYSPALETYFKKGVHLEWSSSPEETIEIIEFYLKNESSRERIARRGQKEAYAKHTYAHRAREALEQLKKLL